MDASVVVPKEMHEALTWLGKQPPWFTISAIGDTGIHMQSDMGRIADVAANSGQMQLCSRLQNLAESHELMVCMQLEAYAAFLAEGPKLFRPTQEQWDSMEHVELNFPSSDFRSPYPAIAVSVPLESRKRLAKEYNRDIDCFPMAVLVRHRRVEGQPDSVFVLMPHAPEADECVTFLCRDNVTIESIIRRRSSKGVFSLAEFAAQEEELRCLDTVMGRAALNMCLMLTHYGCKISGPLDPAAYRKHRAKKHLQRFKHADFLTVELTQEVVVRDPRSAPSGQQHFPTGVEVRPHWRRGSWCAWPGKAAERAAGNAVPLYFRRPCLVRRDRAVGNLSETSVEYVS